MNQLQIIFLSDFMQIKWIMNASIDLNGQRNVVERQASRPETIATSHSGSPTSNANKLYSSQRQQNRSPNMYMDRLLVLLLLYAHFG